MAATATILERCRVAPPLEGAAAAEQILPLTFFDMPWLYFHPIHRLLFYKFPCSKTHFLETIVPNFKYSLSQTLKHFFPVAGSCIYPLNSEKIPELRYVPGDSVSVTIAEASEAHDLNRLTGNQPRVADEFYAFFSELPQPERSPESEFDKIPLFTAQITLFPDAGVCVGFNNHHIVGDASSIVSFIKAWCSVAKLGSDDEFSSSSDSLPLYDRSVVSDQSGLLNHYWNQMSTSKVLSLPLKFPLNKVRATYILQKRDVQKLRDFVQSKKPHLTHLSSFTITSAYVWTSLVKSAAESGDKVADDEPEYFAFAVDSRQRMDPPVPAAYFGNCVGMAVAISTHAELKGGDGFLIAVELIGDVIGNKVNKKGELLRDADEWLSKFGGMIGKRMFGVAGSPKFDLYDADFGWGNPNKFESVSIDGDGSMSLCKSREFDGGLEIGMSLSKEKMDAFANIFSDGLN
ncbi:malonyl-coenzyme:anthocyanin 5-O-glucoside-6'''-O-malonyltransferase-like [Salvia miltiorrhiza]|uniref:malonyl-coenzyme:anthocyanin 5-O-glucoside-6'''-O-malonyltransferase-like n=1 Tax=Salvia miltiorrhiza TaxID=226208 RepID=UPI0025AD6ACF|nr:malonyl-coenzyme:anthocyanin 5-O-glucoside-6'''-O-malonyltransferase-like [Salvia miltiorrhiza]